MFNAAKSARKMPLHYKISFTFAPQIENTAILIADTAILIANNPIQIENNPLP